MSQQIIIFESNISFNLKRGMTIFGLVYMPRVNLAFIQIQPKIETTEGLDPLSMLTDDAQVACWNNEGLPTDSMSTENATILTNSARWPLMIDPQL